jgi:hypothetical protein
MKILCFNLILILSSIHFGFGQTMHNFVVTDSDGKTHRLYEDYLDKGKTVVLKFFFTSCPPCIAIAPQWQQKYVAWGSGNNDVQFIEPTTLFTDNNSKIKTYKTTHNLTMPGIGTDGGSASIVDPFKQGTYGPWYGTPSFAVIAPNRTMQYPLFFSEIEAAIIATGAKMPGTNVPTTSVNINPNVVNFANSTADHIKFYVKPKNATTPKIEIVRNTQGQYKFEYPSTAFPVMTDPIVIMESLATDFLPGITAFDLVLIQKHILALESFTTEEKILAADVNSDSKVTAFDIVSLRKLILALTPDFPNNTPSFKSIPAELSLTPNPGNTVNLNFKVVKIGNIN